MAERSWLVRVGGADLPLRPGSYVLGRAAGCDVVLHSANVSRRHARLTVTPQQVLIEDLDSQNGIFMGSRQLGPGPQPVEPGATIVIGGMELSIHAVEVRVSAREERVTMTQEQLAGWEDEPSVVSTSQADALEMVGPLVDKVLREGRFEDADSMLHAHLMNVIESLRKRRFVRDESIRRSVHYALMLAGATGKGRWVDYAFEVLALVRMPLDDELVKELQAAAARVPRIDNERVRAYIEAMKSGERSAKELWSAHQAELVQRMITQSASGD